MRYESADQVYRGDGRCSSVNSTEESYNGDKGWNHILYVLSGMSGASQYYYKKNPGHEAGLSIGLRPLAVIRKIILPQAARIAVPGLSNNFINLFKSTAIGFMIGYKDMMAVVSMETSRTYRFLEGYSAAMLIYWGIITVLSFIQKRVEDKLNQIY